MTHEIYDWLTWVEETCSASFSIVSSVTGGSGAEVGASPRVAAGVASVAAAARPVAGFLSWEAVKYEE